LRTKASGRVQKLELAHKGLSRYSYLFIGKTAKTRNDTAKTRNDIAKTRKQMEHKLGSSGQHKGFNWVLIQGYKVMFWVIKLVIATVAMVDEGIEL
jgi:hypothetical protein